jgi:succinyl-CoA synthetase beta subunit
MKIHEFQSRQLMKAYGIPISRGSVLTDAAEAANLFDRFAAPQVIMKVQVLMGGRGKAGGVKRVGTRAEAEKFCRTFLGKPFSTDQSAGISQIVKAVLITEDIPIREEYYLGVVVDRSRGLPVILFSREGGVEIEKVALQNPEAVKKYHFSPEASPRSQELLPFISQVFEDKAVAQAVASIAEKTARLFIEKDASVVEINPLALSAHGSVTALDAKIVLDDNALFRHDDLRVLKDPGEEDEKEKKAKSFGLSYVSMHGNVGCLVNGAGLAMATMDVIKLAGGEPANFLDVGGGATAEQVREGFKIILQDDRVDAILVNIFGGIMKCDVIAEGVIQASREIRLGVPLVVRLEGTRVEEGRKLLEQSGLSIISCHFIQEAAEVAVREAKERRKNLHAHSR